MGARIIQLADYRATKRSAKSRPPVSSESDFDSERFRFWSGASGKRYVHSIYNLLECPELPPANFVLVRRDGDGRRAVMAIGRLTNASMTLNLAELRQRGAQLGANEVHVHLLAAGPEQAKMIEFDLRTGQYQEGAFGPVSSVHH